MSNNGDNHISGGKIPASSAAQRKRRLSDKKSLSLPDFDTLRDMAKNDPEALEDLRLKLCQKVIDNAPDHAKPRLRGLMFQIDTRRRLARTDLEACEDVSRMMHTSLKRMQAMLKDLRTMQSESILLSSELGTTSLKMPKAKILPFRRPLKSELE